jgi:hypothetical protein
MTPWAGNSSGGIALRWTSASTAAFQAGQAGVRCSALRASSLIATGSREPPSKFRPSLVAPIIWDAATPLPDDQLVIFEKPGTQNQIPRRAGARRPVPARVKEAGGLVSVTLQQTPQSAQLALVELRHQHLSGLRDIVRMNAVLPTSTRPERCDFVFGFSCASPAGLHRAGSERVKRGFGVFPKQHAQRPQRRGSGNPSRQSLLVGLEQPTLDRLWKMGSSVRQWRTIGFHVSALQPPCGRPHATCRTCWCVRGAGFLRRR